MIIIKNIFLTGEIQVGKSTMIDKLLKEFKLQAGGFKTTRHFHNQELDGFLIQGINQKGEYAKKHFIAKKTNGIWEAVTKTFEETGVQLLQNNLHSNVDLVVMDELGFFESDAYTFQNHVFSCLAAPLSVMGVIKPLSTDFLNRIRARNDVLVIPVTEKNREITYQKLRVCFHEIQVGRAKHSMV